jgi:hypothetical protein
MAQLPKRIKVNLPSLDGFGTTEVEVEYDYDRGERQWFDAKAGVGSPGYPPSVEVTLIDIGGIKIDPAILSESTLDRITQEVMDAIITFEEEDNAGRGEELYDQLKEERLLASRRYEE